MTANGTRAWGAAAFALALLATGCGFRLAGGSSPVIPDHVKIIAVLPFDNRTDRPEIEQRVTEAVARELAKRGSYRVITDPSSADATLVGAISSYNTSNVQFTSEGRATRVEAVVVVQATLRDRSSDAVLWSQSGLIFREQFEVPPSGDFFDRETLALDEIADGAAGVLVTSIIEGF